jgi:hypothetical protein
MNIHGGGTVSLNTSGGLASGWAFADGNVGRVPLPAAAWLFGSGLLGLICVARRKES